MTLQATGMIKGIPAPSQLAKTLVLTLVLCVLGRAATSETGIIDTQVQVIETPEASESIGFRNGSIIVAPIPFSNPTIGSGLAIGAGYLFKADPGSKASSIGVGGFRSDNGSQGYGLGVNLFFNDNRWLFKALFAEADIRYDLFTRVGTLPIRQDGTLARFKLSYGVTSDLSFGGTLRYLNTRITPDAPGLPPIPPPYDTALGLELLSLGAIAEWDRRDDSVYPTTGSNLVVEAFSGMALSGGDLNYQKAFLLYDIYRKLGTSGVLAARVATCGASSETPFFDQCSLGGTDSFRGFSATQFLGLRSASLQLEYRHQVTTRLGATLFGGIGATGPTYSALDNDGVQIAGGIGARYRVSKKFPVDFSVDVSRNSLQENLLYIYVGQRF